MAAVQQQRHYVLHILDDLDLVPEAAGFAAVITGQPQAARRDPPRSALSQPGISRPPARFRLPVTVARLRVTESGLEHEIVELAV